MRLYVLADVVVGEDREEERDKQHPISRSTAPQVPSETGQS